MPSTDLIQLPPMTRGEAERLLNRLRDQADLRRLPWADDPFRELLRNALEQVIAEFDEAHEWAEDERRLKPFDHLLKDAPPRKPILGEADPPPDSLEEEHRVTMEFDGGGPRLTLHHPEGGCKAPLTCGLCAADLTDPDTKRCYDCEGMESEGCWLQGWFDNLGADELLHGKITVPFDAEWDLDHPIITIRQPATQPTPSVDEGEHSDLLAWLEEQVEAEEAVARTTESDSSRVRYEVQADTYRAVIDHLTQQPAEPTNGEAG